MRESIHKYFKVGLIAFMAYPSMIKGEDPNALESLKKIAYDDYFDAVELSWIKDANIRKEAAKLFETAHMSVCYGAQPRLLTTGLNPNHIDEAERKKAEATLMEAIDEACELGSKGIAFLSGKWEQATRDQAYQQLLTTTRNLCAYAKTKDMIVELEVFDYDIDKAALIGPAPYAAQFAADMRMTCDNFGLMIDLSHIPMTYETSEFVVRLLRPYLTHLHIGNTVCRDKNAEGYGDLHQRFGFPGGSNDTAEVLDFLRVLKNEGLFKADDPMVLSFEVKPWQDEDPDAVVANAKRVLNRAWALLED
ncbi:MAG: sugar phosphate isomerase/epimerase [Oscillospiraceae bacterium]|nr:sugar phosphate isomerase/epimerase [Oscillospiraceae bacterium]